MEIIPALDLRGGRAVRLLKGDFEQETVYSDDPLSVVGGYAAAGAHRVHVVDLDAAVGAGQNRDLVEGLVKEAGVAVQVAGGVRTGGDVAAWLAAGAAAVVMGTAAVREPDRLAGSAAAYPGRVLAALDVKAGQPAVSGWTELGTVSIPELMRRWETPGLAGVILTCVDRDGTLAGPDLDTLRRLLNQTSLPVTYSGGIGTLDHVRAVAAEGAAGLILGKALYEGRFTLTEALAAC